ncbi:BACON domain-containing protein [Sunxiuqinia dokdonensis]|uniref:BACON domain-containing protein n=1 Tax=Sunxiuqinia dokdonensis TaxID=1409788 RepID=A0A0L8V7P2_9BACT|nr:hypothetical protein [Sunxiuqinia dokdonensis]KOH44471.1 hypothetical protein NC99_27010 [Sunxiuqinia dokdonensis]
MKRILKNSIILATAILFFSCSDDFVNERLDLSGVAASAIIISPDWDTDDYQFECEGVGSAGFRIDSKPDWLSTDSHSGNFSSDVASIRCRANTVAGFSKTGIYVDQVLITASEKQYAVPVYYITEGNPSAEINRTFEIDYNHYYSQMEISNSGDGILLWDIVDMPEWLSVDMSQFNLMSVVLGQGAAATIPFVLDAGKAAQSSLTGTITLLTNDKNNPQIDIAVSANLGTPRLTVYSYYLPVDFGPTASDKSLSINNSGNGILTWKFEGLPDWLKVSPENGISYGYSDYEIMLTCDRSKLAPGLNSATIYVKSNDPTQPSYPISVFARAPGDNANVRELEGNLVDATFDQSTNTLYYVTSQPNQLVTYDVTSKAVLHEIALDKAPTCLAVSEDFTKAAVGHGGMISAINLNDYSVERTFEYGYTIYDMEWAKDDWFCYTKAGTYMNNLLWINISSSETAESDDNEMDEGTYLKKVPRQPYVIAARRHSSPSGITVFDLDTKLEKSYRHQSIGSYWFSADGQFMFESNGNVYRTNAVVAPSGWNVEYIAPIGQLQGSSAWSYENTFPWINHCDATHSIFGIKNQDYQTVSSLIYQFEDNDYTQVKTYMYDNLYQPDAQTPAYEVEARYVFSNGSGTELSVLRKGKDNNNWSVEFISVE